MIRRAANEAKRRTVDTGRLPKGGLAAPVAMAALAALSLAGCGDAKRYDGKTEAGLRGKIQPAMVYIAKRAVKLQTQYPNAVSIATAGKNMVNVHGNGTDPEFGTSSSFDVVMRTSRGGVPAPSTVMSVSLEKDDNPPRGYGPKSSTSIELASPDGGRHGYGGLFEPNPHPDGWDSGELTTMDLGDGVGNPPGGVYSSSVPFEFEPDGKDDDKTLGPIRTSGVIAADARALYREISGEIVQNPPQF